MMKPETDLLERTVAHVLEDSAFVFAMPMDEPPPDLSTWQAIGVSLAFEGPFSGHFEFWAPFEVAKLLSSNMLGMDEDSPDAQEMCFDAMRETLNILCGNLLTEIAGSTPVFNLGTPVTQSKPEPLPDDGSATEVWLTSDGHPILLRMHVKDENSRVA